MAISNENNINNKLVITIQKTRKQRSVNVLESRVYNKS